MAPQSPVKAAGESPDVDYVIKFNLGNSGKPDAEDELKRLLKALAHAGLATAIRPGEDKSLLIFVRPANAQRFQDEIHKYRVKDWLHGVRMAQPSRDEPSHVAERLRIVRNLITYPPKEGGAGVVPETKEWKHVGAIFALHDPAFNRAWIKKWSTMTFLKREDLDEIRNMFGEKVAYYFAFTQFYFAALMFPAVFGFSAWVLLGYNSPVFAVVNVLWCVTFVEYWKQQEVDLALRWSVKNVSTIQEKHPGFQPESEHTDSTTGETVQFFPAHKRLTRQLLQIPFALLAILVLGSLIATCFAIEVFLSEIYTGPFKDVLVYIPTVILTVFTPIMTSFLSGVAARLTAFENYETSEAHNAALTSKLFVLNFITSYLGIFLTAFVYVPFGGIIVPALDVFHLTAGPAAKGDSALDDNLRAFAINPARLRKQVIYFTVTAQIVNLGLETVLPYVQQRSARRLKQFQADRAADKGGAPPDLSLNDHTDEVEFLRRVRHEAALAPYEVAEDLREMVVQFGYLALFGVAWPLVPCSFLVNNWVELRSDAAKIGAERRRPDPLRRDGVGPWLDSLSFLAWLGSVTSAALVYLFRDDGVGADGTPAALRGWALLLTVLASEHLYLAVRWAVRRALGMLESDAQRRERAERYLLRKRYFDEHFGGEAAKGEEAAAEARGVAAPDGAGAEGKDGGGRPITRAQLEEDLRAGTLQTSTASDRFWTRQRGWQESLTVGAGLLGRMADADEGRKNK